MAEEATDSSPDELEKKKQKGANCPSCGYHVGGLLSCPRCGERVTKSNPLFLIKTIAIIGSIIGVIFLWGYTRYVHEIPSVEIAEVNEAMNGALVRITGDVTEVNVDEGEDRFIMTLSQAGDDIDLLGFNMLETFRQYFEGEFPPNNFDRIEVISQINIDPRFGASMFLRTPQWFRILERWHERETVSIGNLSHDNIGENHVVEAQVMGIERPGGIRLITLNDGTGELDLVVPDFLYEDMASDVQRALVSPGQRVKTVVEVGEFRDELQLDLASTDAILVVGN